MSRKESREVAMQLLFEINYSIDDCDQIMNDYFDENEISPKDKIYIMDVIKGTLSNVKDIDILIEKYSKGWKINRLAKVDLTILRLSIFEIKYTEIPDGIVINEAVEIAKKYGSEKSSSFINGVLGSIVRGE